MLAWGRGGGHLGLNERQNVVAFSIFLAKGGGGGETTMCLKTL